jgi:hypothetical protein
MSSKWLSVLLAGLLGVVCLITLPGSARAQNPQAYQLQRFYYYPYYYFPFDYWPTMGPRWPEQPNQPYMRPPAYMAYPPYREANWRYEFWQGQRFYRGFHFWLDQF